MNNELVRNKGGRPLKFKTNAILEKCEDRQRLYTMSGLAYHIGCDRATLVNYGKNDKFFHTIKKAKTRILQSLEENALMGKYAPAVAIFSMKCNHGFKEPETNGININNVNASVQQYSVPAETGNPEKHIDPDAYSKPELQTDRQHVNGNAHGNSG